MTASLRGLGDPALGSWEHPRPWDARKRDRDLICQILEHYEAQPGYGNLPRPNLPGATPPPVAKRQNAKSTGHAADKLSNAKIRGRMPSGHESHETTKTTALALAAADRTPLPAARRRTAVL